MCIYLYTHCQEDGTMVLVAIEVSTVRTNTATLAFPWLWLRRTLSGSRWLEVTDLSLAVQLPLECGCHNMA